MSFYNPNRIPMSPARSLLESSLAIDTNVIPENTNVKQENLITKPINVIEQNKKPLTKEQQEKFYYAMVNLEAKINEDLGFRWWKKYIGGAFWNQISTPINLSITLLTAITTAQTTSNGGFISENTYKSLSITTLIISVLNTFFKPNTKMTQNIEDMNEWTKLGCIFEEIFYREEDIVKKLEDYKKLQMRISELKYKESPEKQNFVTDLIHACCLKTFLRDNRLYINPRKAEIKRIKLLKEEEKKKALKANHVENSDTNSNDSTIPQHNENPNEHPSEIVNNEDINKSINNEDIELKTIKTL